VSRIRPIGNYPQRASWLAGNDFSAADEWARIWFRVVAVTETPVEVVIEVETTADRVDCPGCGVRAEAQDRMVVEIRDLPAFGRPARLGVVQAPVALPRGVVRDEEVDRDLRARLGAGGADPPRGDGGVPPGG
jgi:hypothetical protein